MKHKIIAYDITGDASDNDTFFCERINHPHGMAFGFLYPVGNLLIAWTAPAVFFCKFCQYCIRQFFCGCEPVILQNEFGNTSAVKNFAWVEK